MNIGFKSAPCMAFAAAHGTGAWKSSRFSINWVSTRMLMIRAYSSVLWLTQLALQIHLLLFLLLLAYMSTTSSTSWKIQRSRRNSNTQGPDYSWIHGNISMVSWYTLPMAFYPCWAEVHLSQTRFAAHLVEENNIYLRNVIPDATPYCSGLPINAIPESDKDEESPTFQEHTQKIPKCCRFYWLVGAKYMSGPGSIALFLLSLL